MAHLHELRNTDAHFSIDPISRSIRNGSKKTTLIQYDHNSEIFTFEMPRVIEGHDMTLCNRVEIHYINIEASSRKQNTGVYIIDDYGVSDIDDIIVWSWTVSNNATQLVGSLSFALRFACVDENDTIDYAWSTSPFSDIVVSNGLYNGEEVIEEYSDILAQWERKISVGIGDVEQDDPVTMSFILTDGTVKTIDLPVSKNFRVAITDLGDMQGLTVSNLQDEIDSWLSTMFNKAADDDVVCADIETVICRLQDVVEPEPDIDPGPGDVGEDG